MTQIFLTDALVRTATCPPDKQQILYWDGPLDATGRPRFGAVSGLGLRVSRSGTKAFVHAYRFNGQRRRLVLGDAVLMNVEAARLAARQRELEINAGRDPLLERTNYRRAHSLTVRELADEYFRHSMSRRSLAHQQRFRALIAPWVLPRAPGAKGGPVRSKRKAFGELHGDQAAVAITPRLIMSFIEGIGSDHQANAALRLVRAMYNWGLKMQLLDMRNPADPLELRRIVRRRRDYTPAQIKAITGYIFQPALEPLPVTTGVTGAAKRDLALRQGWVTNHNQQMIELCNYMGILLLTMARPKEVREARFEHFDLDQLIWHKHDTKGLKLSRAVAEYGFRSVPVHQRVIDLVIGQRLRWPDSELVFPCHTDLGKPRDNFHKALQRFKALPDVPDYFQLYDLKRIAISLMLTGQGVSREAVSHYVDHRGNLETTMIYDLGLVEPLRPVTNQLAELLEL